MGISDLSPPWIFILGLSGLSPPWISYLWAFQLFHHHGFSSLGFRDYHHHGLAIYGHISYFTTIDWHLWAFLLYHHRRSSPMGLLVQCLGLVFLVWLPEPLFFLVQCLESVFSFRVTVPDVHIHWHYTSYLHGFAFVLVFPHFVTLCLSRIHRVVHIGQSPLDVLLYVLQGGSTVTHLQHLFFRVTFGDILEGAWILSIALEAF